MTAETAELSAEQATALIGNASLLEAKVRLAVLDNWSV